MRVGLIDVDNYEKLNDCFPNLVLMKLSAWHKRQGDSVEFYEPMFATAEPYDVVYMSKVFNFSKNYDYPVEAKKIIKGGTGYSIKTIDGLETIDQELNINLPDEIEHIFPDYSLYGITDTAYGFLTRGCPRGCGFCHVAKKEGKRAYKVADLAEFWNGQKYIEIMDPNLLASPDAVDLLKQLKDSGATVDFNQGLDIRLLTPEKLEVLRGIKIKMIHFAWDRPEDGDLIKKKLTELKEATNWDKHKVTVYILTNFHSTFEQDIERVEFVRSLKMQPFITVYNMAALPKGHKIKKLRRYVNSPVIFWKIKSFAEYNASIKNEVKK